MKLLFVGDIVGRPGREAFARFATRYKANGKADIVIANAENSAAGRGITPTIAEELFGAGADAITLGDHTWDQKDLIPYIDSEKRLVRPANFAPGCPGRGYTYIDTPAGPLMILSLIGRVFMPPQDCPLRTADQILKQEAGRAKMIFVDIHAEATSEKIVLGRYLDGRVSAMAGTHTHVQTADEAILPRGSGYITDAGMTGPKDSVIGRELQPIIQRFLTGMPTKFDIATDDVRLEGVLFDIDPQSGRCKQIQRVSEKMV
jgi:metallophosphoesterase (TIGR00282 family)